MVAAPPQIPADLRECALYRFWVRHPVTGQRVLGYVGETARMPFVRLMEHVLEQPWADTILAWEVDDTTYPGKAAVLAAEKAAIEAERPLYNIEGNMGNPSRIPPWTAVQQRQARQPGWVPPVKGTRLPRQRAPRATSASAPRRSDLAERVEFAARLVRWVPAVAVTGWVTAVAASGPVATWYDGLAYGAGVAATAVGLSMPGPKRRRRRTVRRRR